MSIDHVIDPVTGKELDAAWRSAKWMPPYPKAGEPPLVVLVLLGTRDNQSASRYNKRIQVGYFNENVQIIGGTFAFDLPGIVAWQHPPALFKE